MNHEVTRRKFVQAAAGAPALAVGAAALRKHQQSHASAGTVLARVDNVPLNVTRTAPGATQFSGWPFTVSFSDAGGHPPHASTT